MPIQEYSLQQEDKGLDLEYSVVCHMQILLSEAEKEEGEGKPSQWDIDLNIASQLGTATMSGNGV